MSREPWEEAYLPTRAAADARFWPGSSWRSWFIIYRTGRRYIVMHEPSRRVLTEFDRLGCARRFCKAIDSLNNWSTAEPRINERLDLQLHQPALRVTCRGPELRAIVNRGSR